MTTPMHAMIPHLYLAVTFLLPSIPLIFASTILLHPFILDNGLTEPQGWSGISHWLMTSFFIYTMMYIMFLPYIFGVSRLTPGIESFNKTGIPYDNFGTSLSLHGTIISSLKCYPRISLRNSLFLVSI